MAKVEVKLVINGKEMPLEEVKDSKNFKKFKLGDFNGDGERDVVANVYLLKEKFEA